MRLVILDTYDDASEWAAKYIKARINEFNPGPGKHFVLGLPTGEAVMSGLLLYNYRLHVADITVNHQLLIYADPRL
jgi:6-phosphogluconolactonase/glucosamine-6-phosphate isomerase/deaminase